MIPEYGSGSDRTLALTTGWGRHRQHWADIILESVALHPVHCTVHCTSHMYTGHRYCQANGHQSQTRSFSSYNVTVLHLGVNITPQHLATDILYCHYSHGWLTTLIMFLAVAGVIRCYDHHDTERYSPDTGSCVDTGQGRETGTRHGLRQDQDLPPGKVQLAANLGPGNISKIQITIL